MSLPEAQTRAAHAGDPEAQCQLALYYLQAGLGQKARRWLEKACEQNHPAGLQLMGRLHADGSWPDASPASAQTWFDRAISAGCQPAVYDKAILLAHLASANGQWQRVVEALFRAAETGTALAWRLLALMTEHAHQDALLAQAYRAGDALAARLLAANAIAAGDERAARYWLQRTQNNLPKANAKKIQALLATAGENETSDSTFSDTSTPFSVERFTLANLDALKPIPHTDRIHSYARVFSAAWCEYLISLSEPLLRESMVLDPSTGERRRDAIRTNESATLGPSLYDPAVLYWRTVLTALAGLPERNAEWLSVLHYRHGDEYRHHYDFLMPKHVDFPRGGHRRDTVLVYLNDDFDGGATEFPRHNLQIAPQHGSILHFCSMNNDGTVDQDSLHAGLPVSNGEKWLASLWIRQQAFR